MPYPVPRPSDSQLDRSTRSPVCVRRKEKERVVQRMEWTREGERMDERRQERKRKKGRKEYSSKKAREGESGIVMKRIAKR